MLTSVEVTVDIIYLDFQKAFDKVPHKRLIHKIKNLGIGGEILDWITCWLKDRKQRVVINGNYSSWVAVLSGVPQGSILGPLLFLIFINDIDKNIFSKILKFADDTKILSTVGSEDEAKRLQNDLNTMYKWSEDWQMLFNADKSFVMQVGYNNKEHNYVLGNNILQKVEEQRDLGVIIQKSLKQDKQVVKAANSANQVLGMIKRTFVSKHKGIMLSLYKALVRPRLEYCIQAWRPHLHKDIDTLEKVQRRATKMIDGMEELSYEKRLEKLELTTLETRRLRGDLIEVFKILRGFEDIDKSYFFKYSDTNLRGHSMKLAKSRFNLDSRKYFFSNRVINEWNKLEEETINAKSINSFKKLLDRYLKVHRGFK